MKQYFIIYKKKYIYVKIDENNKILKPTWRADYGYFCQFLI